MLDEYLNEAKNLAEKYNLDPKKMSIVKIKNFFSEKNFIYYGMNKYFFEIKKNGEDNFFPFFNNNKENKIEIWVSSISKTYEKHMKIVKNLDKGKSLRDNLKKKYKI